mmetsp:Transcript_27157/g.50915  ORF Transcript_27157/g.50915 Transcript_27157/m.50915 type:complete len:182 (-) Transcript_27157:1894-2439(-)
MIKSENPVNSSFSSANNTDNICEKRNKKQVRFQEKNQVVYIKSVLSLVSSERELAELWLTPSDWQRKRRDFRKAMAQRCPTVERHQPKVQAKRKERVRKSQYFVLREQFYYRRELLDSSCVCRTTYQQRVASVYHSLSEKSKHAAHQSALVLHAELRDFTCKPLSIDSLDTQNRVSASACA